MTHKYVNGIDGLVKFFNVTTAKIRTLLKNDVFPEPYNCEKDCTGRQRRTWRVEDLEPYKELVNASPNEIWQKTTQYKQECINIIKKMKEVAKKNPSLKKEIDAIVEKTGLRIEEENPGYITPGFDSLKT